MPHIRTEKHLTITEAHPFHRYLTDERQRGGNALVEEELVENCPLCREEIEKRPQREGWVLLICERRSADNFGGVEVWYEVQYRHSSGRTAFGTGRTPFYAKVSAQQKFNPVATPTVNVNNDSDIPF